jgi:hypothetical protein
MARKARTNETSVVPAPARGSAVIETPAKRETTRSPAFVSIYVNDVQVYTSPWDMRLVLGEMGDTLVADTTSVNIKELGELRMSPQLAKKLTMIIVDQLKEYERRFGEIPLSKD